MKSKHLIIGLDGATFKVIMPWVNQGKLPNIGKLIQEGVHGNLESTLPPITGAAWSTFQTGVNPGKHGVFDWLTREESKYDLIPINSNSITRWTLWDLLSTMGKEVGVVGVPVTYPPSKVNGFKITGLLTPEDGTYTYPRSLAGELEKKVGEYRAMPEHWPGRYEVDGWFKGLKKTLQIREKTALYLMKEKEWDLFMIHLMETDSIQHQMWHLIDKVDRPRYFPEAPAEEPILEIYKLADDFVGQCIDELNSQDNILLISDHGFGSLFYNVYLNNWLREEGYLKLKRNSSTLFKKALEKVGFTQKNLYPWLERTRILGRGRRMKHGQIYELTSRFFLSAKNIDWKKTLAYSYGNIGQIYLNIAGREPQGIIPPDEVNSYTQEIISKLSELENPINKEKVVKEALRKEDIYHGPQLEKAPEILVSFREGYMASGASEFISSEVISPTFAGSGWHRMEGILVGRGGNLKSGGLENGQKINLVDLLPTILYSMGLSIPKGLDGRVAKEIFQKSYLAKNEILHLDEGIEESKEKDFVDNQEAIKERLKGLGYF